MAPKAGPQLPRHLQHTDDIDRSMYDDGVGDSRGYYHDGAYTAAPEPDPSALSDEEAEPDEADRIASQNAALRKAYFASLTTQFLALRALLHRAPPPHRIAALPRDHGTEVGSFGAKSWTFRVWTKRIRHTDPLPVQVAALDRQSALKLLRVILGGKFIRRGYELRERTSRWLWALLARLPDRGEMDYAEVGWIRELGKRAVLMMVSIAQMDALREEVEGDLEGGLEAEQEEGDESLGEMVVDDEEADEGNYQSRSAGAGADSKPADIVATTGDDDQEDGEVDMDLDDGEVSDDDDPTAAAGNKDIKAEIAAAKARLLARLEKAPETQQEEPAGADDDEHQHNQASEGQDAVFDEAQVRANMRATLNMILTVAGEFYGQRDLLEFRDPFPAQ